MSTKNSWPVSKGMRESVSRPLGARCLASFVALCVGATTVILVGSPSRAQTAQSIFGLVRIDGCVDDPGVIEVGGIPMTLETARSSAARPLATGDSRTDAPPRTPLQVRRSRVQATDDPGIYSFALTGLAANVPYLVATRVVEGPCKMGSLSRAARIAFAGSKVDLVIKLEPATLEVHMHPTGPLESGEGEWGRPQDWRHTHYIHFDAATFPDHTFPLSREFRSAVDRPATARLRWEVSRLPMNDDCAAQPGTVASGEAPYAINLPDGKGRGSRFSIDFKDVILKDQALQASGQMGPDGLPLPSVDLIVPPEAAFAEPIKEPVNQIVFEFDKNGNPVFKSAKKAPQTFETGFVPTDNYFVRAVPLQANGKCAGGVSPRVAVELRKPPPPMSIKSDYTKVTPKIETYRPFSLGTKSAATCYVATAPAPEMYRQFFEFLGWSVPAEGDTFCFKPASNDFWDDLADFAESLVDVVAEAFDWAATAWEDIQAWVVDQAAGVIDSLPGLDCSPKCRDGLKAGLKVALSTMGIPPTIPNFKELVEEGKGYVIESLVEQAGDHIPGGREIAREIARKAVDAVLEEAERQLSSEAKGGLGWAKLDPARLPHPAIVTVKLSLPPSASDETGSVRLCLSAKTVWVDECQWVRAPSRNHPVNVTIALDGLKQAEEPHIVPFPRFAKPNRVETEKDSLTSDFPVRYYGVPEGCGSGAITYTATVWKPSLISTGGSTTTPNTVTTGPCRADGP